MQQALEDLYWTPANQTTQPLQNENRGLQPPGGQDAFRRKTDQSL
jgi:hypothetical protein